MTNDPINDEFIEMQAALGRAAMERLFPGMTIEEVTAAVEEELILDALDPTPLSQAELNAMEATRRFADAIFAGIDGARAHTDEELAVLMVEQLQGNVSHKWPLDITSTAAIVADARRATDQ